MHKDRFEILKMLSLLTQIGLSMFVPVFLCVFGAGWLQRRFSLGTWIVILGILLGVGAGFSNLMTMIKRLTKK